LREKIFAKATTILKALAPEEARDIIYCDDGKIVILAVRAAHLNMLYHKYDKREFINLYTTLVNLDQKYIKSKTSEASKQIREKKLEPINLKLFALCKDMDEVYAKKLLLKLI
jgi:hypothetical protein